jgi:phosphoribosylformimino-5-aminoimidazole carboxamide ribonucleotide (ProFAR) isomerase
VGSPEDNQPSQASGATLSSFELLPAIDVSNGLSVRPGENSNESFGSPIDIASAWIASGAKWIHLVDLDAAYGRGQNRKLIAEVAAKCSGINVQVSGGIRDSESLAAALATGAARINLASSALLNMGWVEEAIKSYGNRISVSLDVSGSRVIARGTKEDAGEFDQILTHDVARDGSLAGPNIELLEQVLAQTSKPVIASGGISELSDLEELMTLRARGLAGAILGKALYVGRFSLEQALQVVSS